MPALAVHVGKDAGPFDAAIPDPPEKMAIPASPMTGTPKKPEGN